MHPLPFHPSCMALQLQSDHPVAELFLAKHSETINKCKTEQKHTQENYHFYFQ